jgi:signal transduction histidine kinase
MQKRGRYHRQAVPDRVFYDGEGIPADELPRVFDKFYRRKGTRDRGTGLGLAIVRRIVEDHGGRVEIASEVGAGTTIRMSLPISEQSEP